MGEHSSLRKSACKGNRISIRTIREAEGRPRRKLCQKVRETPSFMTEWPTVLEAAERSYL